MSMSFAKTLSWIFATSNQAPGWQLTVSDDDGQPPNHFSVISASVPVNPGSASKLQLLLHSMK